MTKRPPLSTTEQLAVDALDRDQRERYHYARAERYSHSDAIWRAQNPDQVERPASSGTAPGFGVTHQAGAIGKGF